MRKIGILLLISLLIFSCKNEQTEIKPAKNIILLIGDGMGVTQIYAAISVHKDKLNIEEFKNVGFHKTYSATDYITDSGAGGTALATGVKTCNQCIGVDTLGNPLKTILDYAFENEKATGLVSTSAITHATPASFIAHEKDRSKYENIAKDFLDFDVDLFIGGGKNNFNKRSDSLNLLKLLKDKDYNIIDGYKNINPSLEGKFAVFTAQKHNPEWRNGRGDMLPVSTEKAIEILNKDEDGFFLMVEGSQIDWGGHDNDFDYVVTELIDFDNAIGKALEFAKKDGNTLVIVTADHETGGLTLNEDTTNYKSFVPKFSTIHHTGVMVPVFAYGPGAEYFGGIYENTDVFEKMLKAFGFKK